MSVRVINLRTKEGKQEVEEMRNGWVKAWKKNAIKAIHDHARFRFTADGKCYSMVPDGEFIGYLMLADNGYDFREHLQLRSELRATAGAIVIYDDHGPVEDDEILIYRDAKELVHAWRELHQISGVAVSDVERLAEYDEEEDDDE